MFYGEAVTLAYFARLTMPDKPNDKSWLIRYCAWLGQKNVRPSSWYLTALSDIYRFNRSMKMDKTSKITRFCIGLLLITWLPGCVVADRCWNCHRRRFSYENTLPSDSQKIAQNNQQKAPVKGQ